MSKKSAFIMAALLLGATPALAQNVCVEPAMPASVDGKTVNHDRESGQPVAGFAVALTK